MRITTTRRSFTTASIVAGLALFASCQREAPPEPVAPAPAAASNADAIALCRAALDRISRTADDGRDFFAAFARGCADVHAEPDCRDAWRRAIDARPEKRTREVAAACAPAACRSLPEPKPALCDQEIAHLRPATLDRRWAELYEALIRRDVADPRDAELATMLIELQKPPPPPPVAQLQILAKRPDRWLVQVGTAAPETLAAPLSAADLARLAQALSRISPPPKGLALIRADDTIPDRALESVSNALHAAGLQEVAIERVPAPPR